MEPFVNKPEAYLNLLKDFTMDPWDWNSPLIPAMEAKKEELSEKRIRLFPIWEKFLNKLSTYECVYEVKETSIQHGFHLLSTQIRLQGPGCKGLVFLVSMLGLYGVFFVDYDKPALVPLDDGYGKGWLSYYPYDEEGEILSRKIFNEIGTLFPDFSKFDNAYASIKVNNIYLGNFEKELDLFKAIFTTNTIFL
ncbi:hypothetical protein [Arthrospiribacter ruber]|uniref:Uncharacterized protein n=1 Tax=Arthrospiribacter ruber TaxID=2487934 RepID=A0A951IZ17_9BACT|nr:hypothetical protein [Arthrospiribacter ruber]MBW3469468.1 hypothetical protein [Arthrospiribacter ruber]